MKNLFPSDNSWKNNELEKMYWYLALKEEIKFRISLVADDHYFTFN